MRATPLSPGVGTALSPDEVLASALAELEVVVAALASVDASELSEGALGESVLRLMNAGERLQGTAAAIGERFAHSREWSADGARDAIAWLRGRTTAGFGPVRGVIATGRHTSEFPAVGLAMRHGEVTARHLDVLADVAKAFPRLRPHLHDAQPQLIDLAQASEPGRFRRMLTALCYQLDPDGAAADARDHERDKIGRAHV